MKSFLFCLCFVGKKENCFEIGSRTLLQAVPVPVPCTVRHTVRGGGSAPILYTTGLAPLAAARSRYCARPPIAATFH